MGHGLLQILYLFLTSLLSVEMSDDVKRDVRGQTESKLSLGMNHGEKIRDDDDKEISCRE